MKKSLKFLATAILVLIVMVSCTQDTDGIFKAIINTSATSAYKCSAYIGKYGNNHYVLTNNKGIIYFGLEENKATEVKTLDTGDYKAIRSAIIIDDYLYGLETYGTIFKVNLAEEEEISKIEGDYSFLAQSGTTGYTVTSKPSEKELTKLNDETIITSSITDLISREYFVTPSAIYKGGEKYCTFDSGIKPILVIDEYVVLKGSNIYPIYKVSGSDLVLESAQGYLDAEPTAAFKYDDNIYFKTSNSINAFNTKEEDSTKSVTTKTDGWAKNICTSTTKITEFVTIDSDIYSINESGGILFINIKEEKTEPVFSE